jgi:hypothetical protein
MTSIALIRTSHTRARVSAPMRLGRAIQSARVLLTQSVRAAQDLEAATTAQRRRVAADRYLETLRAS